MRRMIFFTIFLYSQGLLLGQSATVSGCMVHKDGGFLLQVEGWTELWQLSGSDLAVNLGNRVEIQGTQASAPATVKPATKLLDVLSVSPRAIGGCLTVAASLNASTSMPPQAPVAKPAPAR